MYITLIIVGQTDIIALLLHRTHQFCRENLRIHELEFEIIERRSGYVLTTKTSSHPEPLLSPLHLAIEF